MLRRLLEKYPSARIAQADASGLPFPTNRFDAVLTVHVMHLIPPWREALREFRRVLVPRGIYLNVRTWDPAGINVRSQMRDFWRGWLKDRGVDAASVGIRDGSEFLPELKSLGAQLSEVEVVRYSRTYTLRGELDRFESRTYSDAWNVPEDLHVASVKELRAWVDREYGDLDQERADEVRFTIDVARFES
jgi:SAM-dependent methyltransferase